MGRLKEKNRFSWLGFFLAVILVVALIPVAGQAAEDKSAEEGDATGTDPRDFSPKFMPYFYYTKLENDLEVTQFNLFGMYAFTPRFALTYDLPIIKELDYSDVDAFQQFQQGGPGGTIPPIGGQPGLGGGLPFDDIEDDGDVIGAGDLNLRFFVAPQSWRWSYMGGKKSASIFPVIETTLPTATNDVIGGEAWILSPGLTLVFDMPIESPPFGLGFFAMMNFYDFDAVKDEKRIHTSRFRGRWFWMQPLSKPASMINPDDTSYHIFDLTGFYLLTEFQPIYDFNASDFDLWIGPELGKILKEGQIFYVKPGWGIDNEGGSGDRDFSLEIGFRYFM